MQFNSLGPEKLARKLLRSIGHEKQSASEEPRIAVPLTALDNCELEVRSPTRSSKRAGEMARRVSHPENLTTSTFDD